MIPGLEEEEQTATSFPLDVDRIARGEISDDSIRSVLRVGLLSELRRLAVGGPMAQLARKRALVRHLSSGPIAVETAKANEQHYEVPSEFWRLVLGRRLKYSCACWDEADDLETAEAAMLELISTRADVKDGQSILDLGCGWGALTFHLAERYPNARILSLSNSRTQKAFIETEARSRGLSNIAVELGDIARWHTSRRFDRVLSVEMFEHARNYRALLRKISGWMMPDALLFIQILSHRQHAYLITDNWMADHFFTGGMMPSIDLLLHFQGDLTVAEQWCLDGTHYRRTSEAWLLRLDMWRDRVLDVLRQRHGEADAVRALIRWRLFFLAVAEAYGFAGGQEWMISQHLLRKRWAPTAPSRACCGPGRTPLRTRPLSPSSAIPTGGRGSRR
ncbi:SAM-dependent methyltransferase [Inquilinus limosus]|uniref:SAM-dependent methyltransferase n=1 Tax=Inquilinus limosus TaxID=171674 RepID=UPI003F5CD96C